MKFFGFLKKRNQVRAFELEKMFRWKYENLKNLLRINSDMLETMADIQSYSGGRIPEDAFTRDKITELLDGINLMIESLNYLTDEHYIKLYDVLDNISSKIQKMFTDVRIEKKTSLLLPLTLVDRSITNSVGGKAGNLGVLKNFVSTSSLVPDGFVITTGAYHLFLNENNLQGQLMALYSKIELNKLKEAESICNKSMRFVENGIIPDVITNALDNYLDSLGNNAPQFWAVRSSAVGEDGEFSFAGQFDSFLNVPKDKLAVAYLKVIASRFKTNAILYRLSYNIKEAESPMAVLFIPMIDAEASGVIYTRDPSSPYEDKVLVSSVKGLAADLVGGKTSADSFYLNSKSFELIEHVKNSQESELVTSLDGGLEERSITHSECNESPITVEQAQEFAREALKVAKHFGSPQDIEWSVDKKGVFKILQSRPLLIEQKGIIEPKRTPTKNEVLVEGGAAIFPGVVQGQLFYLETIDKIDDVPEGCILLTKNAPPELVKSFPKIMGIISEVGHPTGHTATVAREFSIPTLFNVFDAVEKLKNADEIGLDAIRKIIYAGLPWPDLPTKKSFSVPLKPRKDYPLNKLIFKLNLTDPGAANFTPDGCDTVHDIVRFVHEKAVAALFNIGDQQVENLEESFKILDSSIPLFLTVLIIGNAIDEKYNTVKRIPAEAISSIPFRALWRGVADPKIKWTGRTSINLSGLASVVMSNVIEDGDSGRRMGDRNYLIVSPEYFNLNARLAYHYSMIDAFVCDRSVNNYITFRFRGGGAGRARRGFRAKFLTGVLLYSGFSVDRREDLVTAWFKGHDRKTCEEKLEMLGRLTGCARQLDMLLNSNRTVKKYIEEFLAGNYRYFQ
ncbi:MAG: hypothetical protein GY855_17980 [candidate division Zixibacteria bacterium]|nr:hypothetical protein [candidate division Zixibacteria bacterium]